MACTVFLWDYILTFGMEVDVVWTSKWNFMKGLYLFQRYLPFTELIWLVLERQSDVASYRPMFNFIYRSNGANSEGDRVSESILY